MYCVLQLESGEQRYLYMPVLPLVPEGELIIKVTAFSILDIDTEERVLATRVSDCNLCAIILIVWESVWQKIPKNESFSNLLSLYFSMMACSMMTTLHIWWIWLTRDPSSFRILTVLFQNNS